MKAITLLAVVIFILPLFPCSFVQGQGTIVRKEGHFVGNLDFIESSATYRQRPNRITRPSYMGGFPNEYEENRITVKGMVSAAVLTMDWWSLFGEPVENYNFQWTSTGQYYVSVYGGMAATISRNQLQNYPDLLLRFDALKPLDIKFVIYWRHSDEAYKNNLHYSFSSSNRNQSVTTTITTGMLFEPSGKSPLSVPGIRQGKGLQFINQLYDGYQHYTLSDEAKKTWLAEFNKATSIKIDAFYVTEIRWPVAEMKAIAELYSAYENGTKEPTPMEQVSKAEDEINKLSTYIENDFWGETVEPEDSDLSTTRVNGKYGLVNKKGVTIVPPIYDRIHFSSQTKTSIAHSNPKRFKRDNFYGVDFFDVVVYSDKGKELFRVSNAQGFILEDVNCLYIRTPTSAYMYRLKSFEKIWEVAYTDSYYSRGSIDGFRGDRAVWGSEGINVPSDIIQGVIVHEFMGLDNRGNMIVKHHVYGVTESQDVRFIGTLKHN
ncbi:hypothetical protein [Mongoliitalea daihaiensis]|uniref:hypothetical protein n=1 Tax=Mongoliitalea daihaiensis TaxID=2782006 RepID=UPI001F40F3A4|nr:hypothetical protein [Mongoliitalea daihaiensis]UJP64894.1 hypothetical protein IPZ59_19225 [Mongoliitalea daihaiensis]